ncbi:hypothetical protein AB0O76_43395 [Streptomyces sp. NPDC086554]|uniref:hypothetical protein n=1 Tax=Streptomyces sp. NPDC086554 TaxID=3154864 RepID=UPI00343164A2
MRRIPDGELLGAQTTPDEEKLDRRHYRTRLRITQKRGQPTLALAATVDILSHAAEEPLCIGRIDAADTSWTFMLFLNAAATAVLACTGVARCESPAEPATDAK